MNTLHVTNGDCAAGILRQFLTDPVAISCDVLHDGPAPQVDPDEFYDVRARYHAASDDEARKRIRRELAASDRAIVEAARHDGVVLWFEHDLFDQLQLIRILDLIARLKGTPQPRAPSALRAPISLICIDRFPGVERFIGLGQLTAAQLASLVDTQQPVTGEQSALATRAWAAFRDPDPHGLVEMVRQPETMTALPFLAAALHRFLEEYPSTANGLSRTADAALRELERGPRSGRDLFVAAQAREERPFIGDWGFFDMMKDLADARVPLITIDPDDRPRDLLDHRIGITESGREVLAGRRDAVALNGINLWRGGVHLIGDDRSPWRWDHRRETLV